MGDISPFDAFADRIDALLAARQDAQERIDNGTLPTFPEDSRDTRESDWRVTAADTTGADVRPVKLQDVLAPDAALDIGGMAARHDGTLYFELPGIHTRQEARLWHDIFRFVEEQGQVPPDSIRTDILVDTVQCAFDLDEILYELRDYAIGLNWDRYGYLHSFIHAFHRYPEFVLPDRAELAIGAPFLRALGKHAMRIGEKRGVKARGFPVPSPDSRNPVVSADLLQISKGKITADGVRENLRIALAYLRTGAGSVTTDDQRQDAASAGLALAQLWQCTHHATGVLDEGRKVDIAMIERLLAEEGENDTWQRLIQLIAAPNPEAATPPR